MGKFRDMDDYQTAACTTAIFKDDVAMPYLISGLCSEAGEVAGKYKKILRDKDGVLDTDDCFTIGGELGDVLWYIALLADKVGFDLSDIAEQNLTKLFDRKERGVLGGSGDTR